MPTVCPEVACVPHTWILIVKRRGSVIILEAMCGLSCSVQD